ncbi:hypothetical protein FOMPIDRAFT_1052895 [Fomitopsis schrenkii]|uniref:Transmembrane protein n=1 Tax=Fomitopsis schrenkii TaxID=2126942 RepID=S8DUQ4_FOMSC|nr:hypothetical protein FOMPIDRAFT_1052895 [Fomitopsis schrenkii]
MPSITLPGDPSSATSQTTSPRSSLTHSSVYASSQIPSAVSESEITSTSVTTTPSPEDSPSLSAGGASHAQTTSQEPSPETSTRVSSNTATGSGRKGVRAWVVIVAIIGVIILIILLGLMARSVRARRKRNLSDLPVSPFEPEFMKDPSMFAEPFVSDLEADKPTPSLPSVIYPEKRRLITSPPKHAQVHQLYLGTDNFNSADVGSPSRSSPEPIVPQMRLRLVGDVASDASSRDSRSEASELEYRGANAEVTSLAQRGSVISSQFGTLPLPHDQNMSVPLQVAPQAQNIPDALIPGRTPRILTPLAPQAVQEYSSKSLPQPPSLPQPSTAHAWNPPWVPDPSWGYVNGSVASSHSQFS